MPTTKKTTPPKPTPHVFVSSTRSDMLKYREKMQDAIMRADCMPVGMERFGADSIPPLDKCFEELATCQIYLCAIGMRYGDIEPDSGKSYTELEYDRAEGLGMPMLVFFIDEENASFKASEIETGDGAEKLRLFKARIKNSRAVTYSYFSTPDQLSTLVLQAITKLKNTPDPSKGNDSYIEGAKLFRKFVTRPARYRNTEATLRVRFDGEYGGWRLRAEVVRAFGFEPGNILFMNDIFTLGIKPNVDHNIWVVDCFADGEAADWLEENEVEPGTIFEGVFKFVYEKVENGAGILGVSKAVDAYIANLVLVRGIDIISRDVKVKSRTEPEKRFTEYFPFDAQLE